MFVLGLFLGAAIGIAVMCLTTIGKEKKDE